MSFKIEVSVPGLKARHIMALVLVMAVGLIAIVSCRPVEGREPPSGVGWFIKEVARVDGESYNLVFYRKSEDCWLSLVSSVYGGRSPSIVQASSEVCKAEFGR